MRKLFCRVGPFSCHLSCLSSNFGQPFQNACENAYLFLSYRLRLYSRATLLSHAATTMFPRGVCLTNSMEPKYHLIEDMRSESVCSTDYLEFYPLKQVHVFLLSQFPAHRTSNGAVWKIFPSTNRCWLFSVPKSRRRSCGFSVAPQRTQH